MGSLDYLRDDKEIKVRDLDNGGNISKKEERIFNCELCGKEVIAKTPNHRFCKRCINISRTQLRGLCIKLIKEVNRLKKEVNKSGK